MRIRCLTLLAVLLTAAYAHGQVRTVALTSLQAPGAGSGSVFHQFSNSAGGAQASLDNDGHGAFLGRMTGGAGGVTTTTDTGIWSSSDGTLALVAREGAQAPGVPAGAVFSELNRDPVLNDAGQVAFPAFLREGSGGVASNNSAGIWAQRNGQLQLVVRSGAPAPGAAGANFGSFTANANPDRFFAFNNAGHSAFTSTLALSSGGVATNNDSGIWSDLSGALSLVAREGHQASGAPAGAVFDDLTGPAQSPVLNNHGQLAFAAQLRVDAGGVTIDNNHGVWLADKDGVSLVLREGTAAPTPTGATFRNFNEMQINDAGNLLFHAQLNRGAGGVTLNDDDSIWLRRNGELVLAAREGSQVPGAPTGAVYGSFSSYALNNHNRVAVSGYLQIGAGGVAADNNAAVWSGLPGNLRITAREGQLAPEAEGAVFLNFFPPSINATGKVAFMATLKPNIGNVDATNDAGIWATDAMGTLQLIAREGDQLEVSPGDLRTITALGFHGNSGNGDCRYSMFNDRGELQFWAQFESSEGVFISELVESDPSPADFNGDGAVDGSDLATWKTGFGSIIDVTPLDGDANGDTIVDGADFLAWQQQLSGSAASAAATGAASLAPEPAAGSMLLMGVLARFFCRRRAT